APSVPGNGSMTVAPVPVLVKAERYGHPTPAAATRPRGLDTLWKRFHTGRQHSARRKVRLVAVTIKDVARAAGVSASTACRALGSGELVRPETRGRVRQAAAELGYPPNRAARGLSTGRSGNIGLIVTDLDYPVFQDAVMVQLVPPR